MRNARAADIIDYLSAGRARALDTTRLNRNVHFVSWQNFTMNKRSISKRRYSQHEPTFFLFERVNTTDRPNTFFRPLATSTPYEIEQSHSFNSDSPRSFRFSLSRAQTAHVLRLSDALMRHQRPSLTPPVFCSTPKQTRRRSSTVKRKVPLVISQRRLQFTTQSQSPNDSKRLTVKNVKVWLL